MLGIIFELTNTILYDENILLGHLFNFKNLNGIELDVLKKNGEKTFEDLWFFTYPVKKKRQETIN